MNRYTRDNMPKRGERLVRAIEGAAEVEGGGPIRIRLSDESVDRYNSILKLDGWDLEKYERNPVVLLNHDSWSPPIGRSKRIWIDKEKAGLYAEPEFAPTEMGRSVEQLIRGGWLNAASVGWAPIEMSWDEKRNGVNYLKHELLEWSVVTVPGNANALVEARAAGINVEPIVAHVEHALRMVRAVDPKRAAELEQIARMGATVRTYVFQRGATRIEAPDADGLRTLVRELVDEEPAALEPERTEPEAEPEDDEQREGGTCPNCGAETKPDWKFCAACGTPLETRESDDEDEQRGDDNEDDETREDDDESDALDDLERALASALLTR